MKTNCIITKKLAALLLILLFTLSFMACGKNTDIMSDGGNDLSPTETTVPAEKQDPEEEPQITDEPLSENTPEIGVGPELHAILARVTEGLEGDYELLALSPELRYGNVDNTHTAYAFLCRVTGILGAEPRLATVVADVTDQSTELLAAEIWPIMDDAGAALPEPDYLQDMYYDGVADIPVETAGASLKAAGEVVNVWLLCARIDFASLEQEAVGELLSSALAALDEESRIMYEENAPGILNEVRRLLDPKAELSGEYEDAGVADCLTVLRREESVRASIEAFLNLVEE